MAANISPAFVLSWGPHELKIADFEVYDWALSSEYSIDVSIVNPQVVPPLNERVHLFSKTVHFCGFVECFNEQYTNGQRELKIGIVSPLSHYLKHNRTRVYHQPSLKDLLDAILTESGLTAGSDFELNIHNDSVNMWHQQVNECSFTFLQKLLVAYNISYQYQNSEQGSVCVFSDEFTELASGHTSIKLTQPSGLNISHETGHVSFSHKLGTGVYAVCSYDVNRPGMSSFQSPSESETTTGGRSWSHQSRQIYADSQRKLGDESLKTLTLTMPELNVKPGFRVTILSDVLGSKSMYVKSIQLKGNLTGLSVKILLVEYLSGLPQKNDHNITSQMLHTAKIEHHKSMYPGLSDRGRYQVRLNHDLFPDETSLANPVGKASLSVRNALYYAGQDYGFSAPFSHGSEILIGYQNGDMNQPVIMGGFYNQLSIPAVSNQTPNHSRFCSNSGHQLTLFEQPEKTELYLATGYDTESLTITQAQGEHRIHFSSLEGTLHIESLLMQQWVGDELRLNSQKEQTFQVKKDISLYCHEGDMVFNSKSSISANSQNQFNVESSQIGLEFGQSLKLNATHQLSIQCQGLMKMESEKEGAYWHCPFGTIFVKAKNSIKIKGGGSEITLTPQGINIQTAGIIQLNGASIEGL